MNLLNQIKEKEHSVCIIGLGYVGLPLAIEFAEKYKVIGFDVNEIKVKNYRQGIDSTNEVGTEALLNTSMIFTSDEAMLKDVRFYIIAVPTPINQDKTPDLGAMISASEIAGRNLISGSIVVYESTVYPGVTEDICVPILEKASGLKCGIDFKVGYSPERINPGDKIHTVTKITKIVSGMDREALETISGIYGEVITAGIYQAESIKVAEAAKVIENSQRDINIAFMNELSIIFDRMGIDTKAVLKAAKTKWNFLNFMPGLVGGHCIGVDPYYLTHKAAELGYHPEVILAGRRINDRMGKHVAEHVIKTLCRAGRPVHGANIAVLGLTFKENVPDIRNSKVTDIITELKEYGATVIVSDPIADPQAAKSMYGVELTQMDSLFGLDAVVLAVNHAAYQKLDLKALKKTFRGAEAPVLIDVKAIFDQAYVTAEGYLYWSL